MILLRWIKIIADQHEFINMAALVVSWQVLASYPDRGDYN